MYALFSEFIEGSGQDTEVGLGLVVPDVEKYARCRKVRHGKGRSRTQSVTSNGPEKNLNLKSKAARHGGGSAAKMLGYRRHVRVSLSCRVAGGPNIEWESTN